MSMQQCGRGNHQSAEENSGRKCERGGSGRAEARFRLHRQDYLHRRTFLSLSSLFFFSLPASIQQIGKLIRLRLVHADKRLDGYTIEIKRITRSADRGVGPLRVFLSFLSSVVIKAVRCAHNQINK